MKAKKKRLTRKFLVRKPFIKGKKAQDPATMIFYYAACFLFAGFVAYAYMKIAYTGAKSTKFNMEFFVNDVGLMTDAIYAVPGSVEYDYRKNPSKFIFDFRENALYVYTPVETAKINLNEKNISSKWSSYNYLFRAENPFVKGFIFPLILSFKKTGTILEISATGAFKEEEYCPSIDTAADIKEKNIYIDPGQSPEDKGHESASAREFEITARIAESLNVLCRSHSLKCTLLAQKKTSEKVKELSLAKPRPDLIISIHIGRYNNPEDKPFKAMFALGSDKAEKLSCIMGNKFRKNYFVFEPVKVDAGVIAENDYRALLSKSTDSMILEIGNMNNPQNFDQNDDINGIADNILKGLEDYYSKEKAAEELEIEEEKEAEPLPAEPEKGAETKGSIKAITR